MSSDRRRSRFIPALATVVGLLVVLGIAQSLSLLPHFGNPVKEKEVDRTGPAVLQSLSDLSDYHAATAELQVIIDIEKDVKYVPSFLAGERTTYLAVGRVDGVIDLSKLDSRSVVVSTDGTTKEKVVTITVPPAALSEVTLDVRRSKVIDHDQGISNRVADFFSSNPDELQQLQVKALPKLEAAARETEVLDRAQENTEIFLRELAERSGADKVVIRFQEPETTSTTGPG